jgi:hypothetical protein
MTQELQPIPFQTVEQQVQAYLANPASGDPTGLVNRYFQETYGPDLGKQAGDEAQQLLFDTQTRRLTPRESDYDPEAGNLGTIAMRLPYWYPLHTTLFSWYTEGRIGERQNSTAEQKATLAQRLREDCRLYGLIPDDLERINRRLAVLQPDSGTAIAQSVPSSPPWYKRLNPRAIVNRFKFNR